MFFYKVFKGVHIGIKIKDINKNISNKDINLKSIQFALFNI